MKLEGRVVSHMEASNGRTIIRVHIKEGEAMFRELGLFMSPPETKDWPIGTIVTVTVEKAVAEKEGGDEQQA